MEIEHGRGAPQFYKSSKDLHTVDTVLMSTVLRFNDLEIPERRISISDRTRFELTLPDRGRINQSLEVNVIAQTGFGSRNVNIGHYDPAVGHFMHYPELVTQDEFSVIEPLAHARRNNALINGLRINYDADIVRGIRKKHREVLLKDQLIYKIVERHNDSLFDNQISEKSEYLIDDSTTFFASLSPRFDYVKSESSMDQVGDIQRVDAPEAVINISFWGDLQRKDGKLIRNSSRNLTVGNKIPDDPYGGYMSEFRLVTDKEFEKILCLTKELQGIKATTHPKLNTELVGLKK